MKTMTSPETSAPQPGPVEQIAALSTGAAEGLLKGLGISGRCAGLGSHSSGRVCGRAFTVQFLPVGPPDGRTPDGTIGDYVGDVPQGYVLALDNRGDTSSIVWTEALARVAAERGVAGVVMDGRADGAASAAVLPVFSSASHQDAATRRVRVEACNLPIAIGGVRVECDDIVLADAGGVVVIPKDHIQAVLNAAKAAKASNG